MSEREKLSEEYNIPHLEPEADHSNNRVPRFQLSGAEEESRLFELAVVATSLRSNAVPMPSLNESSGKTAMTYSPSKRTKKDEESDSVLGPYLEKVPFREDELARQQQRERRWNAQSRSKQLIRLRRRRSSIFNEQDDEPTPSFEPFPTPTPLLSLEHFQPRWSFPIQSSSTLAPSTPIPSPPPFSFGTTWAQSLPHRRRSRRVEQDDPELPFLNDFEFPFEPSFNVAHWFQPDMTEFDLEQDSIPPSTCSICEEALATIRSRKTTIFASVNKPKCPHSFCSTCFQAWIAAKVEEQSHRIKCPAPDCTFILYTDDITRIATPEVSSRFKELASQDFKSRLNESETAELLKAGAVACPDCKVLMIRSTGCDQMQCTCGAEFCYKCKCLFADKHRRCGCPYIRLGLDVSMPFTCTRCTLVNTRQWHRCEVCMQDRHPSDVVHFL